jgi:hypothetical protein
MRTAPTLLLTATIAAIWASPCDADAVLDWNFNAGEVAKAACLSPAPNPFHESRMYAMAHIAAHDALNAIQRQYEPYAYDSVAAPGTSAEAAVAAAARDVLVSAIAEIPDIFGACVPGALARVEADYTTALDAIPDGDPKDQGIALGQAAAAAIIALRSGDGADTEFLDFAYIEGTAPGEYRFFDNVPFAAAPGWGQVTPFALQSSGQFLPQPPYPASCARPGAAEQRGSCQQYAADVAEVKAMGGNDASTHARSPDQTQIAYFWIESSPLAWNRMGRAASGDAQFDLWENARLFALLNMGMADGYIASMNTKYHYAFWRPVTAIHLAGEDGNQYTVEDPDWAPLDPTPQVPDYESAHAVEGAVAAEVFRRVFQTDHAQLSACSLTLPDPDTHCGGPAEVRRSFTRFSDAARENGESRILVGYHFRLAVEEGLKHGRKIGAETVGKHLRPAR